MFTPSLVSSYVRSCGFDHQPTAPTPLLNISDRGDGDGVSDDGESIPDDGGSVGDRAGAGVCVRSTRAAHSSAVIGPAVLLPAAAMLFCARPADAIYSIPLSNYISPWPLRHRLKPRPPS